MHSSHGELEPSTGGAALGLRTGLASLSTSRHDSEEMLLVFRLVENLGWVNVRIGHRVFF